jgi:hypothetical protein
MMGTSTMRQCAADPISGNENPDPWPPDANDDRDSDVGDLIALFGGGVIMNRAAYRSRSDFTADGAINVGDIIAGFGNGKILVACG